MRAFAQADRFVGELRSRKLRAAYVFVGDEAFFRKRFRDAILEHLVPPDLRDFSLFEFDLAENDLAEVLDRARTPSLMAPFQVFFVRGDLPNLAEFIPYHSAAVPWNLSRGSSIRAALLRERANKRYLYP